jgi:hypothetical protein
MDSACRSTAFSIAKDGKYHDATFRVDQGVVSVLYWGADGVTRRQAQALDLERPEETACQLLSQIVEAQPQFT